MKNKEVVYSRELKDIQEWLEAKTTNKDKYIEAIIELVSDGIIRTNFMNRCITTILILIKKYPFKHIKYK